MYLYCFKLLRVFHNYLLCIYNSRDRTVQCHIKIISIQLRSLLTGDLNATPNATEIRLITDCTSRNISDLTEQIDGTFHNYGAYGPERRPKIDYIFASEGFAPVSVKKIADVPENGVYYSDHFAVMATVKI
jgi:endonuclease/exonuclease/phosphatase family metal-dependent hydrolase